MNTRKRVALIFALVLLAGVALVAVTSAMSGSANAPLASFGFAQDRPGASLRIAQGGAPAVVAYQGELRDSGTPYNGVGYFKFAIVDAGVAYWSNDGTSSAGDLEPTAAVELAVSDGLFSVLLGDTVPGMTEALTADAFSEPDRTLRVWFSSDNITFDQLAPDTRIAAVPYALQAEEVANVQNVVIVAKSGGDYTSVQAAIDSISDAAADNAYLVWVAPGVYSETVMMKPHVHLQGAGQAATVISSTVSSSSAWPPTQATLVLASDASLRDLTVNNSGAGHCNVALLATAGTTRTLAADVTTQALVGGGVSNYAIFLSGSGTGVTLQRVTALAENGSDHNWGLGNVNGAAVLRGGAYTGRGGTWARGIFNYGSGSILEAESVTALGENGSDHNPGFYNWGGAVAVLRGGDFTGRGGNQTGGVANAAGSTLTAQDITALAENGTENYALGNYNDATMTVRGATVTARGGLRNYALSNEFNVTMDAENVTALAENGSDANHGLWNVNYAAATVRGGSFTGLAESGTSANYGLRNLNGSEVTLRGGSFTGRGGAEAWGIFGGGITTTLEAESVTAMGEESSGYNWGLFIIDGAAATLRGGSFTGRGGEETFGIFGDGITTTLDAEGVTALGEGGDNNNNGLGNYDGATATLRGGSFTARGEGDGGDTHGIYNIGIGTEMEAESWHRNRDGG